MGRYDVGSVGVLFGLNMGMVLAILNVIYNVVVRYCMVKDVSEGPYGSSCAR